MIPLLLFLLVCQGCPNEVCEQLLRLVGTGLEFRVELYADEPGMVFQLDDLHQPLVRREPSDGQSLLGEQLPVAVVEFPTVTMPLVDQ